MTELTVDHDHETSDVSTESQSLPNRTHEGQSGRETLESIIVAVILAFLFRTFVGEMFVIPTGSMASTLQGRHVDVKCDMCGYRYRVSASDESRDFDNDGDGKLDEMELESQRNGRITHVGCSNCGRPRILDPDHEPNERSFNGDRIIVSKFAYDLANPDRWQVIVFKYPGNAKVNYIKRLVGLPNEILKIRHGNVYTTPLLFNVDLSSKDALELGEVPTQLRTAFESHNLPLSSEAMALPVETAPSTSESHGGWARRIVDGDQEFLLAEHEGRLHVASNEFQILRKPSRKLLAMLQPVNDSRFVSRRLFESGWPTRWQGTAWETNDAGRSFTCSANDESVSWLRYHHFAEPSLEQWQQIERGEKIHPHDVPVIGNLILDHYAYNYNNYRNSGPHNWVGDLAVEAEIETAGAQGQVWVELVRAGVRYRCRFDLATGQAVLSSDGTMFGDSPSGQEPVAKSPLKGKGKFDVRMTNVDDELRVWVNGKQLSFNSPTYYQPTAANAPFYRAASPSGGPVAVSEDLGDTAPVGVGAKGVAVTVRDMRVMRDIYYAAKDHLGYAEQDFNNGELTVDAPPSRWLNPNMLASRREIMFVLGDDQYFPLGDNSPHSSDARRWSAPTHYVERDLLIGKALLIYWPHPWRLLKRKYPIIHDAPFLPDFKRMGLIR